MMDNKKFASKLIRIVFEARKTVGICLLDHVIITKYRVFGFKEKIDIIIKIGKK